MLNGIIARILQNPLFLKLKDVVENNGYHDHEDAYSHSIKIKDIALKEISGDFITNPTAKKDFTDFVEQDFHGFKRRDIMILISLVHDIGKILGVRENGQTKSLLVRNESGATSCPGHEYWGSTIIPLLLKDLSLPIAVIEYIAAVVKNHDIFNPVYFEKKASWPMELLINDVKSRTEGLYKEALFNIYCDCFDAAPFQETKEMIVKIFNKPDLYKERQYVHS